MERTQTHYLYSAGTSRRREGSGKRERERDGRGELKEEEEGGDASLCSTLPPPSPLLPTAPAFPRLSPLEVVIGQRREEGDTK